MNAFAVRIADVTLSVRSVDPALRLAVHPTIAPFLVADVEPNIELTVRFGDLRELPAAPLTFDSGGVWKLYDDRGGKRFELRSPTMGEVPYKAAWIDPAFRRGEIILHAPYFSPNEPIFALEYPIDELLFMHHLAAGSGVVMHGCGLVDAGRGFLFLGASGAGKSTMGTLWQKHRNPLILSDDRIVLTFKNDSDGGGSLVRPCRTTGDGKVPLLWMSGTPWHGEASLAEAAGAPLERIFLIRHAAQNSRAQLSEGGASATAVARLFACGFPPFHDRAALAFVMKFLARVAASVPVEDLGVVPTREIIDTILA